MIHAAGTPLKMSEINAEFALGNDLGAYRSVRWYMANGATDLFPATNIAFSGFYSTSKTSSVTPGSQNFTSSGTLTVPTYSVLTITLRGGAGGGGGGSNISSPGNTGNPGAVSSFGSYGSGDFGRGGGGAGAGASSPGVTGANGAGSDGTPLGGAGGGGSRGSTGGTGGAGGKTVLTLNNPLSPAGTGPAIGSSVTVTVGAGGSGGAGAFGAIAGSVGSSGSVLVEWS